MSYKHKKASLNLSINAIVILILAITMLGLGLTFMRGLFKNMQEKVSEAVSASELTNPPTVDNMMTLAPSDITLRQGKSGEVMVAFLNTGSEESCGLSETLGEAGDSGTATLTYSTQKVSMTTDQINTWLISVKAKDVTDQTGIYTLSMECGASSPYDEVSRKDLLVSVTA